MKRNEPCFWITNKCPRCGHSCPMVYSPDLLKGPVERECASINNPMREHDVCYEKWGFAATEKTKKKIVNLLRIAERQDVITEEYKKNRIYLGYKDMIIKAG